MAVDTKMPLTNTADGYLCEGTDILGGYFVIDKIANASSRIAKVGSLCYCTDDKTFYRYSEKTEDGKVIGYWAVHNMPHIRINNSVPTVSTPGNIGDIIVVIN